MSCLYNVKKLFFKNIYCEKMLKMKYIVKRSRKQNCIGVKLPIILQPMLFLNQKNKFLLVLLFQ